MRKLKKQLLRTIIACGLVVSVAAGSTVAYLTDTETATNTFTVGNIQIDLEEPGYPGNDSDEVKNIIPNQEITKDPQVENTGDNAAIVYLKVDVPQETFTELGIDGVKGETKLQDLFKLNGLSENWELIKTEASTDADTAKTKTTYVYAYRKTLDKGTKTDKLFERVQMKNAVENDLSGHVEDIVITACAIQATDIPDVDLTAGEDGTLRSDSLKTVYDIFLKQSGDKMNQGGQENAPVLGTIMYNLDGGTMADDSGIEYTKNDYGKYLQTMISKKPEKAGYIFKGWEPETLAADTTGDITATAVWVDENEILGNITFNYDGGAGEPLRTFYTAADYNQPLYTFFDQSTQDNPRKEFYEANFDPYEIESGTTGDITIKVVWGPITKLITGKEFNAKVKAIGGENAHFLQQFYHQPSTAFPGASQMTEENTVSLPGEKFHAYIWNDGTGAVYLYTEENARGIDNIDDASYMYDGLITTEDRTYGFTASVAQKYKYRNCTGLTHGDIGVFGDDTDSNLENSFAAFS